MLRVHQSEVKAWGQKAPLHSRPVRPRTPPLDTLEHNPHHPAAEAAQYHHAAEAAQYQAAPAPYQAAHDDPEGEKNTRTGF